MFDHQRIGDISGLGTDEVEFLNKFSLSHYNDGNAINQHTGMPFSFNDFLMNDETQELPILSSIFRSRSLLPFLPLFNFLNRHQLFGSFHALWQKCRTDNETESFNKIIQQQPIASGVLL